MNLSLGINPQYGQGSKHRGVHSSVIHDHRKMKSTMSMLAIDELLTFIAFPCGQRILPSSSH